MGRVWVGAATLALLASSAIGCSAGAADEPQEPVGVASSALVIPGLFATGVDAAGNAIADGATDPHYTMTSTDPMRPGPAAIATSPLGGGWVANTATARWISPEEDGQGANAIYTFTATFQLQGVDPTSAVINGTWACDDTCTVALNGVPIVTAANNGPNAWTKLVGFTVPAGSPFVVGPNTISFASDNSGGSVTGVIVTQLSGNVNGCTVDAQCPATQFCDTQTAVCTAKLANGTAIPTIPGHNPRLNGTCTAAVGASVCATGVCDTKDNECGYANGDGPCTVATQNECRSGACSTTGVCEPLGGCDVDADCTGGNWCDEATHTCTPKLANGTVIPTDPTHMNPTLNGKCTAGAAVLVCASGVCDTNDNECGFANGDGPCTPANGGTVCRSGACSSDGLCEPMGGCNVDADCGAAKWCDESAHTCDAKLANGAPVPKDPPHMNPALNGTCTVGAGALVCASGVCDTKDNDCGYADGDGPCTALDGATVCRSGTCTSSGVCGPTGGCTVDSDCGAGKWCDEAMHTCSAQLANGTAIPSDPPHMNPTLDGMCTPGAALLVCVSGVCDAKDNECGLANGDGPCTVANGGVVCRSGACSTNLTCEPAGGCNVDADCSAGNWCNETMHACTPTLPNGTKVPTDASHMNPTLDGKCTPQAGALVCQTGVCDPKDDECGLADGDGPCTVATEDVCRSGQCNGTVCGPATGCMSDAECTVGDWCDISTRTCEAKLANGQPVPNDPGHTVPVLNGMCSTAAGALVCQSGVCDPKDNDCGLANGDGPCTVATENECRSGDCSTDGTCIPTGSCDTSGDCPPGSPTCTNHVCTGCTTDADCPAGQPICDPATHACGPCTADFTPNPPAGACPTAALPACQPMTSPLAGACTQCSTTNNGACTGTTPVCVTSSGTCGCNVDKDCPVNDYCDTTTVSTGVCAVGCRVINGVDNCATGLTCSKQDGTVGVCGAATGCTTNADCSAPTPICDTATTHTCVQCVTAGDCPAGDTCDANMCVSQGTGGSSSSSSSSSSMSSSSSTASSMSGSTSSTSTASAMGGAGAGGAPATGAGTGANGDTLTLGGGCALGGDHEDREDGARLALAMAVAAIALGARRRPRKR